MTAPWITAFIFQWILLAILALLVVGLLRQAASQPVASDPQAFGRLSLGDQLPTLRAKTLSGYSWSSKDLVGEHDGGILLFVTSECPACRILISQLRELSTRAPQQLRASPWGVALVLLGKPSLDTDVQLLADVSASATVLVDPEPSDLEAFGLRSVPAGVVVDRESSVLEDVVNPHARDWLYRALRLDPPSSPVYEGAVPIIG